MDKAQKKIKVTKNGPYLVSGDVPLLKKIIGVDEQGYPDHWEDGKEYSVKGAYSLCRCGKSKKSPFCDGSHIASGFDGTETASRKKFSELAESIEGEDLILDDAPSLCAVARFCDRAGSVWKLTRDSGDAEAKKLAIEEACNCPSGRLLARDKKTGKAIEPKLEPSIGVVKDPEEDVDGPLWIRGRIEIESADGRKYEKRNRITLCRCGKSRNKPFCDGTHISTNFSTEE